MIAVVKTERAVSEGLPEKVECNEGRRMREGGEYRNGEV